MESTGLEFTTHPRNRKAFSLGHLRRALHVGVEGLSLVVTTGLLSGHGEHHRTNGNKMIVYSGMKNHSYGTWWIYPLVFQELWKSSIFRYFEEVNHIKSSTFTGCPWLCESPEGKPWCRMWRLVNSLVTGGTRNPKGDISWQQWGRFFNSWIYIVANI